MLMQRKIDFPPMDEHNKKLLSYVHPGDWINPTPKGTYNLVVIGAGTAGLVTAAGAAGLGAKVALIERHLMGGDCLNVGCVPSKALIRSSRAAHDASNVIKFGLSANGDNKSAAPDFAAVMQRLRKLRADISHDDSAERFSSLGVDVYLGEGSFTSDNTIDVEGTQLKFKTAVIASGARAIELPIAGLGETGYLTNETVFSLTELPKRIAVIGGGPIGCELAQAFCRLGAKVTILNSRPQFLPKEDADAAAILSRSFANDGLEVKLGAITNKVEKTANGKKLYFTISGQEESLEVDEIVLGVGRTPNIEGLNLEKVGVEVNPQGVVVNDFLQTTNPRIYAAGDVCMQWKFTHAADFAARIVIQNALFSLGPLGKKRLSSLVMPWCTFTDPEIAHVGLNAAQAQAQGIEINTFTKPFSEVHRAVLDGEDEGFVRVHVKKGTDQIVGATVVASHAGEMISELSLAITKKIGLGSLAGVIHPYPTQGEAIRLCGDLYNRTRLTATVKKLFGLYLSFLRRG